MLTLFEPRLFPPSPSTTQAPLEDDGIAFPLCEPCTISRAQLARDIANPGNLYVGASHEPHVPGALDCSLLHPTCSLCPGKAGRALVSLRRISSPSLVDSSKVDEPTPEAVADPSDAIHHLLFGRARDLGGVATCQRPPLLRALLLERGDCRRLTVPMIKPPPQAFFVADAMRAVSNLHR